MKKETITTPGDHEATLVYFAKPPEANNAAIWALQLRKTGIKSQLHEDAYQREVQNLAKIFAKQLLDDPDLKPDLVVVPPSDSKQFQPYLEAIVAASPTLPVVDAFTKPVGFRAGDTGRTYEELLQALTCDANKLPAVAHRIWIIDDIFNTGNTVGAMTTLLRNQLPQLEHIVVACPLYIPFVKK
jgi:predicted amidophosphoribosyltransferase